ncbi:hypothetical protein pb186bvf_000734 [Paramecium bursaria]
MKVYYQKKKYFTRLKNSKYEERKKQEKTFLYNMQCNTIEFLLML